MASSSVGSKRKESQFWDWNVAWQVATQLYRPAPLNEKNLNSEIETEVRLSISSMIRSSLNEKNLNSEIETGRVIEESELAEFNSKRKESQFWDWNRTAHLLSWEQQSSLNEKNLNSEIETHG